jgi:hypothetical protein
MYLPIKQCVPLPDACDHNRLSLRFSSACVALVIMWLSGLVCRAFFYKQFPGDIKDPNYEVECECSKCYHCGTQSFDGLYELLDRVGPMFTTQQLPELPAIVSDLKTKVEVVQDSLEQCFSMHNQVRIQNCPTLLREDVF